MISHLFKLPRHRSYNYKPRYYDPIKEEIEQGIHKKQIEQEEEKKLSFEKRISFKARFDDRKYAERKEDRIRLYIRTFTFILLMLVVYLLFEFTGKYF